MNPGGGEPKLAGFEVLNLPEQVRKTLAKADVVEALWRSVFSVKVDDGSDPLAASSDAPAIAGSWSLHGTTLRFQPRFPLQEGQRYRALYDPRLLPNPPTDAGPISAIFTLPKGVEGPLPRVLRVEPTGERVPENLLRLYVYFSSPVVRGDVYRHLSLLDEQGTPIGLPFLELGEELWDPSGTRLTLLFDPGRIKRGLQPRETAGPVLMAGHQYVFTITGSSDGWLAEDYERGFDVGPPDETPIDPATWEIQPPATNTTEPLLVKTKESLDSAMMERRLSVCDPAKRVLRGTVTLMDDARIWEFRPEAAWKPGRYTLIVPKLLEDLAGNQVGRRFEVDALNPIPDEQARAESLDLHFEVRGAGKNEDGAAVGVRN